MLYNNLNQLTDKKSGIECLHQTIQAAVSYTHLDVYKRQGKYHTIAEYLILPAGVVICKRMVGVCLSCRAS